MNTEITQPKIDHTPAELDGESQLLLRAAALLEARGKARNGNEVDYCIDGTGPLCARVALMRASPNGAFSKHFHGADERLRLSLGKQNEIEVQSWSDASSQKEVVAKLRSVAFGG